MRRIGGRSGLVIAAVRRAVEELLVQMPADQISIPMIAGRAGVHPTSVYRRWGDVGTLVSDVIEYKLGAQRPLSVTGDLRSDVSAWALEVAHHLMVPTNIALLRAGAALAGDPAKDCTRQWHEEATRIARQAGLPESAGTTLVDHLLAPILYRAVFAPQPMDEEEVARLIADALYLIDGSARS